jgi:hypothetical protein
MRFLKIDENYALNAAKRRGKTPNQIEWIWSNRRFDRKNPWLAFCRFEPTCGKVKTRKTFHISRRPVVPLAEDEESHTLSDGSALPRFHGPPRLLAFARDPWTIFAYWNVDWPLIFKNAAPVDRQVHLRVHCPDGLEEKEAAVEPMAGMHYVKMSQRHRACRIEIGYYQPADVWNSVATSNEIVIPPAETSEAEHVDLATIPFHLRFQQLVDLFGAASNDGLATVMSRFQTRAASSGSQDKLSYEEPQILQRTGVALSDIADALRAFNQIDREKLKRDAEALVGLDATSPSRGFSGDWTSAGS